ncbi:MAG TPA: hypothetical protein VF164_04880, partial [Trueperaceae bacterium]
MNGTPVDTPPAAGARAANRGPLARDLVLAVVFGVILILLPTVLKQWFGQASVSYLSIGLRGLSLAILALSWDLVARTGQLSLAHGAFYGAGAYTA